MACFLVKMTAELSSDHMGACEQPQRDKSMTARPQTLHMLQRGGTAPADEPAELAEQDCHVLLWMQAHAAKHGEDDDDVTRATESEAPAPGSQAGDEVDKGAPKLIDPGTSGGCLPGLCKAVQG